MADRKVLVFEEWNIPFGELRTCFVGLSDLVRQFASNFGTRPTAHDLLRGDRDRFLIAFDLVLRFCIDKVTLHPKLTKDEKSHLYAHIANIQRLLSAFERELGVLRVFPREVVSREGPQYH